MSLLTIDFSLSDSLVPTSRLQPIVDDLARVRAQMIDFGDRMVASESEPTVNGPVFFRLPEWMHAAYVIHREASELGKVFKIANSLHDHMDAAIVNAPSNSHVQPIVSACCDPHHNELSRGGRGSKPRIYFTDETLDNDSIDALASRIRCGGSEDNSASARTALVFSTTGLSPNETPNPAEIAAPAEISGTAELVFSYLCRQLHEKLGDTAEQWMPRLITLVGPQTSSIGTTLHVREASYAFSQITHPRLLNPDLAAFSPTTLLPAAMMGLDCMKLLQGAAEINDLFVNEAPKQNNVLRIAALQIACGTSDVVTDFSSLHGLGHWKTRLAKNRNFVGGRDCDHRLIETLEVGSCRTDEIEPIDSCLRPPPTEQITTPAKRERKNKRLASQTSFFASAARRRAARLTQWSQNGTPIVRVNLPAITTRAIGQWMQLQLITEYLRRSFQQ